MVLKCSVSFVAWEVLSYHNIARLSEHNIKIPLKKLKNSVLLQNVCLVARNSYFFLSTLSSQPNVVSLHLQHMDAKLYTPLLVFTGKKIQKREELCL
jgi:uncharacterized membrane protein YGL010W